jgi:hypothetical protein
VVNSQQQVTNRMLYRVGSAHQLKFTYGTA